ncbi:hypothetical protein VTN49DRAFT_3671 [Thermomyces lanuginosus]|uniref:uncharacterized protein n=1 Tax=Thermomyces lanuginosus TaxID=5541 RepID=UPI003744714D
MIEHQRDDAPASTLSIQSSQERSGGRTDNGRPEWESHRDLDLERTMVGSTPWESIVCLMGGGALGSRGICILTGSRDCRGSEKEQRDALNRLLATNSRGRTAYDWKIASPTESVSAMDPGLVRTQGRGPRYCRWGTFAQCSAVQDLSMRCACVTRSTAWAGPTSRDPCMAG